MAEPKATGPQAPAPPVPQPVPQPAPPPVPQPEPGPTPEPVTDPYADPISDDPQNLRVEPLPQGKLPGTPEERAQARQARQQPPTQPAPSTAGGGSTP
jgi:hypothetical protein